MNETELEELRELWEQEIQYLEDEALKMLLIWISDTLGIDEDVKDLIA